MNRRSFLGGVAAVGTGALVLYVQPAEQQISDLEDEVGDLDARVTALETQVADQGGNEQVNEPDPAAQTGSGQLVTVEGAGTMVTDRFVLSLGQYRVNLTLQDNGSGYAFIIVEIYDPAGNPELVFNEFGEHSGGPWEGSAIYQASQDGEYFVSVSNTTAEWGIEFEPF